MLRKQGADTTVGRNDLVTRFEAMWRSEEAISVRPCNLMHRLLKLILYQPGS
ncbi:hypothetical protein Hanom_Chr08g00708311 [Helianthus anomalus]